MSLPESTATQPVAKYFMDAGAVVLEVASREGERAPECRHAQASLDAATESVRNALSTARIMNALDKTSRGVGMNGQLTGQAQDALRSALLFAGAGLDFSLKALARNALPRLVELDDQSHEKFEKFATAAMTSRDSEGVDPAELVKLLIGKGEAPKGILMQRRIRHFEGSSAQSVEKVEEIAGALGVNDSKVRRRMSSKIAELLLGRAFDARNEISHELDLTHPSGDRRAALERRKRVRKYDEVRAMAQECLDVTQLIINDVSSRLAREPDSVG